MRGQGPEGHFHLKLIKLETDREGHFSGEYRQREEKKKEIAAQTSKSLEPAYLQKRNGGQFQRLLNSIDPFIFLPSIF